MVDLIFESVSANMYYLACHIIYHYGTAGFQMDVSGCRVTFVDEILSRVPGTCFNSFVYLLLRPATLDHLTLPLFKRFKFAKLPRFRFSHCLCYPRRLVEDTAVIDRAKAQRCLTFPQFAVVHVGPVLCPTYRTSSLKASQRERLTQARSGERFAPLGRINPVEESNPIPESSASTQAPN
jgi:hypothetical protein